MNKLTLQELKDAVTYAERHGDGEHKVVELNFCYGRHGLGQHIILSSDSDPKGLDITDVEAW